MKKSLSLLLAALMVISCVLVLASCGDENYDGRYVYDKMDFKFLMNGEDMSGLFGDAFNTDEAIAGYIEIKGNQMTISGEEGEEPTVIDFEKKDGKLIISDKDVSEITKDLTESFELNGDLDFYLKVEGNVLKMCLSLNGEELGQTIEMSLTVSFKKQ